MAITGATGGVDPISGQRPMRQEFSTFQNSGPAFDLYIQAFKQFVEQNQTDLLSYYLVAGESSSCSILLDLLIDTKARNPWPSVHILGRG